MTKENLQNGIIGGFNTTDNKSVIYNDVDDFSKKIDNILNVNPTNKLETILLEIIKKNIKIITSKTNSKKIYGLEFMLPDYSNFQYELNNITKKTFNKTIFKIIKQILIDLGIKCKWKTQNNDSKKIVRLGIDISTNESLKREIRFVFSDELKYLRIEGIEAINEKNNGIKILIDYINKKFQKKGLKQKTIHENSNGEQIRYIYVNKDTNLFEITEPKLGKDGIDVFGRTIKHERNIEYDENIKAIKIPGTNKVSYYSTKAGFIKFSEKTNNNGILELKNISIIDEIDIPNLDFDISPPNKQQYDNDSFIKIYVVGDVIGNGLKLKGDLSVGKHIRSNVTIDGNLQATCIMGSTNKNINVNSTGNIEIESISHGNLIGNHISIGYRKLGKNKITPIIGKNKIQTNSLKITNLLLKGDLIINIGNKLFEERSLFLKRIKNIKHETNKNIDSFKNDVLQIETDIKANFSLVKYRISPELINDLNYTFTALRSLMYLEPFQLKKAMLLLNYIHEKHEFDFIWGYKIKFNRLDGIYENIISNEKKSINLKEKLKINTNKLKQIVICIDGNINKGSEIVIYKGNKIIKNNRIILDDITGKKEICDHKKQIKIYKKYCLESERFINITEEEAKVILDKSKEENRRK